MKLTEEKLLDMYLSKYKDLNILFEAVSKEQKEKGQRVISEKSILPFENLRSYLINKWNKLPNTKENYYLIDIEKKRFNYMLDILTDKKLEKNKNGFYKIIVDKETGLKKTNSEKAGDNYINTLTCQNPQIYVNKAGRTEVVSDYDGLPHFRISSNIGARTNGLKFNLEPKEFRTKIRKFIIYHEYGHLYEFIRDFVESGEAEIIDTQTSSFDKKEKSEGMANAYAIDNMYRKDRRELLKKSNLDNSAEALPYKNGLKKYSKTFKKTLQSIEKEKRHFNY